MSRWNLRDVAVRRMLKRDCPRNALLGACYCLLASLSILTTRFDAGVAPLWLGSPLLITALLLRPRRQWKGALIACTIGSILASGLVGAGWALAFPFALANMAEGVTAAYLMRLLRSSHSSFGSARWNFDLLWSAGIAGPLVMGSIAAGPLHAVAGVSEWSTITRIFAGHSLSNLAFVPIFKLFVSGQSEQWRSIRSDIGTRGTLALVALQTFVTVGVFWQNDLHLLFLAMLPLVAIAFHCRSSVTALALGNLALIGLFFTLAAAGPVRHWHESLGFQVQFLALFLVATVGTITPISVRIRQRQRSVARMRESEARYRMLAEHSSDIIMRTDRDGRMLFVSPSVRRIGDYDPRRLVGQNILEVIDPLHKAMVEDRYAEAFATANHSVRFEYRARMRDGRWRWFESYCRGVEEADGSINNVVSIIRDICERKERENNLALAAKTDQLTGLANRRAFRETVGANAGLRSALAIIDIDHFKSVNDRFGHDVGDEVLIHFARLAQRYLRKDDVLARIGGEEFAILLPGLGKAAAIEVCDRIRRETALAHCDSAGGPVLITISGGVTTIGPDGLDAALKRADVALYEAKANGRDQLAAAA